MSHSNKSILKSTLMLYLRQLVLLGISLYTVRVVLHTLGIVDYGIYSVLTSLVALFGFAQNAFAGASQRNLAFEIGKAEDDRLGRVFSATVHVFIVVAIVVLLLGETAGQWFVLQQAKLAEGRVGAAVWAYQLILISLVVSIVALPYHSLIIARGRLQVYAYVSILEAGLKLACVSLLFLPVDKLVLFAALSTLSGMIVTTIYVIYCRRNFPESRMRWRPDLAMIRSLAALSGWNLVGFSAVEIGNQGTSILLNLFFGPAVSTARGIAMQVNAALYNFVQSFTTASRAPITKVFAQGDLPQLHRLIISGSKISFFLMFGLSLPFLLIPDELLSLWLNHSVPYASQFVQLVVLASSVTAMASVLSSAANATGRVKTFQLIVGGIQFSTVPLAFLILWLGASPPLVVLVTLMLNLVALVARVVLLQKLVGLAVARFWLEVSIPVIAVSLVAYVPSALLLQLPLQEFWKYSIAALTIPWMLVVTLVLGLSGSQRQALFSGVRRYLSQVLETPRKGKGN